MPEWLNRSLSEPVSVPWDALVLRLVMALALGTLVAAVYRVTRRAASFAATFPATLVLLCVLIAMVTQVIGDNVARAFSLVGALSIVRFRTVVQDTKDTAFVIFAVVVGMAVGAGQYSVAVCGLAAVGAAAGLFRDRFSFSPASPGRLVLVVRLGWSPDVEQFVNEALARHAVQSEQISASTVRQGAALELSFRLRLDPGSAMTAVAAELNRIEGVQGVELRMEEEKG